MSKAQNLGFPAAINEGLKVARGDCLVLLNNDAVVTDGWLNQLSALAEMDSDLTTKNTKDAKGEKGRGDRHGMGMGLVGPMSNYASPPQPVENVPYANLDEMHAFARRWRDEHRGQWFTAGKLTGFCLLMKRAVYEAIGGLDEQFGLGFFDDDDLAERARRAGFELAVAHDLFVHHFGSRTFQGECIDAERLLHWPGALGHLQRSLRGSAPTDSIVRKLLALIARCHQMLGDLPAALSACSEGLRLDPDDAELHFRKAVLHRKAVQPAEAEACWRRILTLKRPDQFCSVDQGIYGHLTLRNLAVLAEERGDRVEARRLWRMVLDACPGAAEAMSRGET